MTKYTLTKTGWAQINTVGILARYQIMGGRVLIGDSASPAADDYHAYKTGDIIETMSGRWAQALDTGAYVVTLNRARDSQPLILSATAAVGTIVTLTIPAAGVNLRQYVTSLIIDRFATALLTAGAAPVLITSTNLLNTPSFSFSADAAPAGSLVERQINFIPPVAAQTYNTAIVFSVPATAGAIFRLTATWDVEA